MGKLLAARGVRLGVPATRPPHPRWLQLGLRSLPLALLGVALAACEGERPHRAPPGAMGSSAAVPIPRMEARGVFFDGQLGVEVMLARAGTKWSSDEAAGESSSGRERHGGRLGGFGGGMGMGGMHGGYGGGGRHGGGGQGGEEAEGGGPATQAPPIRAVNQPPVQLRLRLTNHGAAPVEVQVIDFNSTLGDFVVQPEKITVPPGEAIEADPMISRLGVFGEEIPLTVKLHITSRTEEQVLTLRAVPEPKPPVPPPTAPGGTPAAAPAPSPAPAASPPPPPAATGS